MHMNRCPTSTTVFQWMLVIWVNCQHSGQCFFYLLKISLRKATAFCSIIWFLLILSTSAGSGGSYWLLCCATLCWFLPSSVNRTQSQSLLCKQTHYILGFVIFILPGLESLNATLWKSSSSTFFITRAKNAAKQSTCVRRNRWIYLWPGA